jgi:pyruvyl transferase EpsO
MDRLRNSGAGNSGGQDWLGKLKACLSPALDDARECALIGFPDQRNAGDSAIWLGTLYTLSTLGVRIAYTCCHRSYSSDDLLRRLPRGPILINGGGNLGDLYMNEENLRRTVLRDFPSRRIVQMPQTVYFRNPDEAGRIAPLYTDHCGLHLMVRDRDSLNWLQQNWSLQPVLAPDPALVLSGVERNGPADTDIFCLLRTDAEGRSEVREDPALAEFADADWIGEGPVMGRSYRKTARLEFKYDRLIASINCGGYLRELALSRGSSLRRRLAEQRLNRGLRILSRGRVIVTDRLHGHILSLKMGIPNILLDNVYGKNKAVYECWTAQYPAARWADSCREAADIAGNMLCEMS